MKKTDESQAGNPYEGLDRIFHEPNRLLIMSTLCAAEKAPSFNELKTGCKLTDGNLNRHLKVLQEAGAVEIRKSFVDDKPRTTVALSKKGLEQFNEYLGALGEVLEAARKALPREKKGGATVPLAETVKV